MALELCSLYSPTWLADFRVKTSTSFPSATGSLPTFQSTDAAVGNTKLSVQRAYL